MTKVALYARVSTSKQTATNQLLELRRIAELRGWEVVQEYVDEGISGTKTRADRPALDAMLKDATRGRFSMVVAWSIDRVGRSLQNLLEILGELQALKVDIFFHQQTIDTTTPTGRMIFSVMGALGEFERNLIRERVIAGQQRAIAAGVKMGRPTKMNDSVRAAISLLRQNGVGIKQIAKQLQLGVGTVYSVLKPATV